MTTASQTSLEELHRVLAGCRNCDLWEPATQVVAGAGPAAAGLMLVGEQPGDQEDREGAVFVGPAGRILDEALAAAGISRQDIYLTNAVKHFKWKPAPRGKRRLHQRPNRTETVACRPWLVSEVEIVRPRLIVCLGALAAESVISPTWRIREHRGEIVPTDLGPDALATFHPSAALRAPDREQRRAILDDLVADLSVARAKAAADETPRTPGR